MSTRGEYHEPEGLASESLFPKLPGVPHKPAGNYRLRRAMSRDDVHAAQRLRFEVFNIELKEGLQSSVASGRDEDAFDSVCDHLLVEHSETGLLAGTYRMQSGKKAADHLGYYSAQEFDFKPYEPLRGQLIELGRACVHRLHRNFAVLNLLWRGIADYAREHSARFLIGCSSLTSQDPAEGAALYQCYRKYLAPDFLRTQPLDSCVCPLDAVAKPAPKSPKLLTAYLMIGARICGPPAIDREFKTIDFLTVVDLQSLPARVASRFVGAQKSPTDRS